MSETKPYTASELALFDHFRGRKEDDMYSDSEIRAWERMLATIDAERAKVATLTAERDELRARLAASPKPAHIAGNVEKALHHTISSAAVLANWHSAIAGTHTGMRPGIEEPKASAPACSNCNDTHEMILGERTAMCTACPTPCQKCQDGVSPYCRTAPCACSCHPKHALETGEVT